MFHSYLLYVSAKGKKKSHPISLKKLLQEQKMVRVRWEYLSHYHSKFYQESIYFLSKSNLCFADAWIHSVILLTRMQFLLSEI